jgi:hypothetical protein
MEVKLSGKPLDQRIADRLRPSAGDNSGADVTTKLGTGPTRTITSIRHKGHQTGQMKRGDGDEERR